jgi:single-stranded DNA-binding protein
MADDKKEKKKDWAIHIAEAHILGRLAKPPKEKKDKKIGLSLVVPTFKKGGGRQWMPLPIDVVGDDRSKAMEATVGDYIELTARFATRSFTDDNNEKKSLTVLQHDPYRSFNVRPGEEPEDPFNPDLNDVCFTRVMVAGRHFINKKQRDEGSDTPILREGNGKYCYVKLTYQDPFQKVPEGEWPKDIFFDFSVNGDVAERISKYCRFRAQLIVRGELGMAKADWTREGKSPVEPKIFVMPGGLSFMNLDRSSSSEQKKPTETETYDENDSEGVPGLDDDLPF